MLFDHAPAAFRSPEEDMSFAWFVPLFSLYVVWVERHKLVASFGTPSWLGALATLPFLAIGALGVRGIQLRFEILAFVGLLIAIPWALFGIRTAKVLLFPALFLLFCLPLATFLDVITVHLRLFATSLADCLLNGCGVDTIRRGTMIADPQGRFAIDVAQPCSGLRSIFALMALTAGYAFFNQPTPLRRLSLFACSVPIAILGNVMRIFSIAFVASISSREFATGFYHDYSGYVVFLVAIALMLLTSRMISAVPLKPAQSDSVTAGAPSMRPARIGRLIPPLVTAALVAAMLPLGVTHAVTLAEPPEVRLGAVAGMDGEAVRPSEVETSVLPADTRIERRVYTDSSGIRYVVSLVVGGASKSSIHRPELCLPAQGFKMVNPRTLHSKTRDWRLLTLERGEESYLIHAYTFFNQAGAKTSSHVRRILRDVWDRSVHNRIDRWAMVTVTASTKSDETLREFLDELERRLP